MRLNERKPAAHPMRDGPVAMLRAMGCRVWLQVAEPFAMVMNKTAMDGFSLSARVARSISMGA